MIRHAEQLLTMDGPACDPQTPWDPAPLGLQHGWSVACTADTIVWMGPDDQLESNVQLTDETHVLDATGSVVGPSLIDSHTHALFAGHRSDEFSARVQGLDYRTISERGGGIARTVRSMRTSTDAQLETLLRERLDRMTSHGVGTVEIKSGYGLDTVQEVRALELIRNVAKTSPVHVVPTFLALHSVDPVLRAEPGGRDRFLERVENETLPEVLKFPPAFIDAYVDSTGFSVRECRPILERAAAKGLRSRLHVGQFTDIGGVALAADVGARSVDHLEHVSDQGLDTLRQAGIIATLLPGAAFSLGQSMPDARRMRSAGVQIALATDCNPGTSAVENLPLMAAFAVRQMGLSTVEAWLAITRIAARSLDLSDRGLLRVGHPADIACFAFDDWQSLPYLIGDVRARFVLCNGRILREAR